PAPRGPRDQAGRARRAEPQAEGQGQGEAGRATGGEPARARDPARREHPQPVAYGDPALCARRERRARSATMTSETRSAVERYIAAYVSGDTSELAAVIAPHFVDHSFPVFSGIDGVARAIATLHVGLGDVSCTLQQCVCEPDA